MKQASKSALTVREFNRLIIHADERCSRLVGRLKAVHEKVFGEDVPTDSYSRPAVNGFFDWYISLLENINRNLGNIEVILQNWEDHKG